MCSECFETLHKSANERDEISEVASNQADDESGEWIMLYQEHVTASFFVSTVKRRYSFAPLISKLLYGKHFLTAKIKYAHDIEAIACKAYTTKQREHQRTVFVTKLGLHIDYLVNNSHTASNFGQGIYFFSATFHPSH